MFDVWLCLLIDLFLNVVGNVLVGVGVMVNMIMLVGFGFGIFVVVVIVCDYLLVGCVFIVLNWLFDGLDGVVVCVLYKIDFGGYFDIILDFFFYVVIFLVFVI